VRPQRDYPLLSAWGRNRFVQLPVAPREGSPRSVGIRWLGAPEDAIELIVSAAREGRCACWIRNSVADALEAYDALRAVLGAERVTLFHARFALRDRLVIEQDVVARFGPNVTPVRRAGQVVVATQVLEQSLDVDFDEMVTDLCPVDLVVQRAGRLQRHRREGRGAPTLHVLAPRWSEDPPAGWLSGPFRRTAAVYPDPGVLWRTARALQRGALDLPRDARALIEEVYGEDTVPGALLGRSLAAAGRELARGSVAQTSVVKLWIGYVREGADWADEMRTPTRLGEATTTVRLARGDAEPARPWANDASDRTHWPLSQLSVARHLVARAHPDDEAAMASLVADQPFAGDDVCTIVLRPDGGGAWKGRAIAERIRGHEVRPVSVVLAYSESRGLEITEGV
jgi:CRISPR-associated endonuclease/helicase Cas3